MNSYIYMQGWSSLNSAGIAMNDLKIFVFRVEKFKVVGEEIKRGKK